MSFKVKQNGFVPLGKKNPMKVGTDIPLPDHKEAVTIIDEALEQKTEDIWVCQACGVKTHIKNSICFPVRG